MMQFFLLQLSVEVEPGIEIDPDVLEETVRNVVIHSTAKEALLAGLDGSLVGDLIADVDLDLIAYIR